MNKSKSKQLFGGRRRSAKRSPRRSVAKRSPRRSGKKPLNEFFKLMLAAKKKELGSFQYKGKKYVGRKHPRLGMVYRKQ